MKILEVLAESFRTDRIAQHQRANKLRELYKQRDELTREINARFENGDDDTVEELRPELDAIKDQIKQIEANDIIRESDDHNDRLRELISDHEEAAIELAQMEEDLHFMNNAAHTEREIDEVDDFRKQVEWKRRSVERLSKRVKLYKAAKGIL